MYNLQEIPNEYGDAAVKQLCASGVHPPGISEIREMAFCLAKGDVAVPSPWEAWERVMQGKADTDLEKRALELVGGAWELRNTQNQGVTRSNFVKAYGELEERDRRRRLALPEAKALAASNRPPKITPPERQIAEPPRKPATPEEIRELLSKHGNPKVRSMLGGAGLIGGSNV